MQNINISEVFMSNLKTQDLIDRLYKAVELLEDPTVVTSIFFDTIEDIVTIHLVIGTDKVKFYNSIEKLGILKKDDQLAINWL
jgi:hypothetical protein